MNKKCIVGIVICVFLLVCFIGTIIVEVGNIFSIQTESKEVWITSNVIDNSNEGSSSYFVRYDDHNGETGILYTNEKGNDLKLGDSVTVYRSVRKENSKDSTHAWSLSKEVAKRQDVVTLISLVLATIIDIIVLMVLFKKLKTKKS